MHGRQPDHPKVNIAGQLLLGSLARFPQTEACIRGKEQEGSSQREVVGVANNDDELWGTQFFLLRLRSADKHAR